MTMKSRVFHPPCAVDAFGSSAGRTSATVPSPRLGVRPDTPSLSCNGAPGVAGIAGGSEESGDAHRAASNGGRADLQPTPTVNHLGVSGSRGSAGTGFDQRHLARASAGWTHHAKRPPRSQRPDHGGRHPSVAFPTLVFRSGGVLHSVRLPEIRFEGLVGLTPPLSYSLPQRTGRVFNCVRDYSRRCAAVRAP